MKLMPSFILDCYLWPFPVKVLLTANETINLKPGPAGTNRISTMQKVQDYIQQNKDRFLEELFDLLRIPSISAKPEHKDDVLRCAEAVAESLRKAGADKVEVCPTSYVKNGEKKEGYPIVYGEKIVDPSLPTFR